MAPSTGSFLWSPRVRVIIVEVAPQLPSQCGTDHSFQAQKSLSEQAGEIGQSETCDSQRAFDYKKIVTLLHTHTHIYYLCLSI